MPSKFTVAVPRIFTIIAFFLFKVMQYTDNVTWLLYKNILWSLVSVIYIKTNHFLLIVLLLFVVFYTRKQMQEIGTDCSHLFRNFSKFLNKLASSCFKRCIPNNISRFWSSGHSEIGRNAMELQWGEAVCMDGYLLIGKRFRSQICSFCLIFLLGCGTA